MSFSRVLLLDLGRSTDLFTLFVRYEQSHFSSKIRLTPEIGSWVSLKPTTADESNGGEFSQLQYPYLPVSRVQVSWFGRGSTAGLYTSGVWSWSLALSVGGSGM